MTGHHTQKQEERGGYNVRMKEMVGVPQRTSIKTQPYLQATFTGLGVRPYARTCVCRDLT